MSPHELIYRIGVHLRNRKVFARFNFLEESDHWSRDQLRAHQLSSLLSLVQHAYSSCPFYRQKYDASQVKIKELRSLADLARLPSVSKAELLTNRAGIQVPHYPEPLYYSETSGSTGEPLVFYRNQDWDAWHNASVFRELSWHGVDPWERNGYLWGYNFAPLKRWKIRLLDSLQNRFRLFSYDDKEIVRFLKRLRGAVLLSGYSSMIYELARAVNRSGSSLAAHGIRLVKGTSETILPKYQTEAIQAFGRKIVSEYGAAEAGIIACECEAGSMHVNMETCIVEVENGEIIVTNLVSHSFPIIRYRLGDFVDLRPDFVCECGRAHEILAEVVGRSGHRIVGRIGAYPSLMLYYVFKNLATQHGLVLNYQAVQRQPGQLDLYLEETLRCSEKDELREELKRYFCDDLRVDVHENSDFRARSRKKQDFITEID